MTRGDKQRTCSSCRNALKKVRAVRIHELKCRFHQDDSNSWSATRLSTQAGRLPGWSALAENSPGGVNGRMAATKKSHTNFLGIVVNRGAIQWRPQHLLLRSSAGTCQSRSDASLFSHAPSLTFIRSFCRLFPPWLALICLADASPPPLLLCLWRGKPCGVSFKFRHRCVWNKRPVRPGHHWLVNISCVSGMNQKRTMHMWWLQSQQSPHLPVSSPNQADTDEIMDIHYFVQLGAQFFAFMES